MRNTGLNYMLRIILTAAVVVFAVGCGEKEAPVLMTGLDQLEVRGLDKLAGKRVGLITNHTALDAEGRHAADILHAAEGVELVAIFAPEHGFRGEAEAGEHVVDSVDERTGARIYSIYGETRKPTAEMLEGVDILIFDIQDIGARFYTYISTMGYCMEAAAEQGMPIWVLDRPNPIGGRMAGPVLEMENQSFVGMYPIPLQHGMTVGELAMMIRGENWMEGDLSELDLTVIPVKNYSKNEFYGDWPAPSPNIPNLETALVYPGTCLLEAVNLSEGRGTDAPFLTIGAPWLDHAELLKRLQALGLRGVELDTVSFVTRDIPGKAMDPKFEGELSRGLKIHVTDAAEFEAVPLGLYILLISRDLHPEDFALRNERWPLLLWGNGELMKALEAEVEAEVEVEAEALIREYEAEITEFRLRAEKYFLY